MPIHYRLHRDPKSSHQQISRLVRSLGVGPILDVGAAQGMLAQSLADTGLVLDAVEANPEWAEMARPYYRSVHTSYIQDAPLPANTYRVIVCADVLEHTPDPVAIIRQLRRAATADATFIISVPNVAHLGVRMMLLFGYFPKMDRGPLDATHLQFLTKDSATEMLLKGGLKPDRYSVTGVPVDELWPSGEGSWPFNVLVKCQHAALRLLPRLFGFQWIMVARAIGEAAPAVAHSTLPTASASA